MNHAKLKFRILISFLIPVTYFLLPIGMNAQWEWVNPLPSGNSLNDIAFVNNRTGLVVGNFGTIFHTIDKGENWEPTKTNFTTDLKRICVIDSANIWICGDEGKIYYSNNGNDWEEQNTGSNQGIKGISFYDKEIGYAAGDSGLVLITTNGGKNWAIVESAPKVDYADAVCFGPGVAYFAGTYADFITTSDGGRTWNRTTLSKTTTITKLLFTDTLNGYAICKYGVIFHTTNGGNNWELYNPYTSSHLKDICFFEGIYGIALGDEGFVLNTKDSGKSWTKYEKQKGINYTGIEILDTNLAYATSSNGCIFKTTDLGATWHQITKSFWNYILTSVYFFDSDTGFVAGNRMFKTTDAGKSWKQIEIKGQEYISQISSIIFYDRNYGWAVSGYGTGSVVLITTDGGETWDDVLSYNPGGFCIANKYNLFLVGMYNYGSYGYLTTISRSTDGGYTWDYQKFNAFYGAGSTTIGFFDSLNGITFPTQIILRTSDGGVKWNEEIKYGYYIHKVIPVNSKIGWAVGYHYEGVGSEIYNLFLKTTDCGKTWDNYAPKSTCYFAYDAFFTDTLNGWIKSFECYPNFYKTTDGGKSWFLDELNTNNCVRAFHFPNYYTGYAVGDNGMILRYRGEKKVDVKEPIVLDNSGEFSIYPNPNDGEFSLNLNTIGNINKELRIKIYDLTGRLVYKDALNTSNEKVSEQIYTCLQSGMYIVQATIGGKSYSARLTVGR